MRSIALTNRPALAMHGTELLREQLGARRPATLQARETNPHNINRAALRELGFSDALILESERELFG